MPLPASGPISFNAINVELGVAGTTQASLDQASYRALAGVPSGAISMSNFYGKANQFAFTISSNQTNANLRTLAVNAGWNGTSRVAATINSGIYCSSNGTGTPGLTVNGSFPGGVELINDGFIIGMGGNGGAGGSATSNNGFGGSSGGLALSVSVALSLRNNGTIGGGGGGGGGGSGIGSSKIGFGGGGGGGGRTGAAANTAGGAGGLGTGSAHGTAGGAGTFSAAGGGGSGSFSPDSGGNGGSGGTWGATGSSGVRGDFGNGAPAGAGGGAGAAISGNSNITYLATGTRLGAIT